jgi:hypothetical protein
MPAGWVSHLLANLMPTKLARSVPTLHDNRVTDPAANTAIS